MNDANPKAEWPPNRKPAGTFTLSVEMVGRINSLRAQYIVVYLAWVGIQLYFITQYVRSEGGMPSLPLMVLTNLMYVFFAFRFVQVLRLMQYGFWMYLPALLMAIVPLPGILVVAYIDRGITKTLRKGLDAREAMLQSQSADND